MIILDPGRDLEASDLWPFLLQKGSDKRGFLVDSSTGTFDLKWAFAKRYSNIISTITGTVISTWSSCELIGLLMVCFPSWVCISVHFWLSLRSQPSLVVQVQDLFSQAKKWGHHVSLLTSCLPVPNTLDLDWTGAFWGWWTLGYSMVFRFGKILRPQVLGHTHQVQLHDKRVRATQAAKVGHLDLYPQTPNDSTWHTVVEKRFTSYISGRCGLAIQVGQTEPPPAAACSLSDSHYHSFILFLHVKTSFLEFVCHSFHPSIQQSNDVVPIWCHHRKRYRISSDRRGYKSRTG